MNKLKALKQTKTFFLFLSLILLFSCNAQQKTKKGKHTNNLIHESSPYLLQHAYNPVDWNAWNEEALQAAKTANKLMVISVGYAACHWCHVMEHESFEDTTVAQIMNEHFVSIKVDREERPDIDQIYMNAAYLINKRGGWPLNAIALPDGRPIFAGTYFPKKEWLEILEFFQKKYEESPKELEDYAKQITDNIQVMELIPTKEPIKPITKDDLSGYFDTWQTMLDFKKGGKDGAPKFPMPNNYQALLRYYDFSKNEKALAAVQTTLENMAFGGIYDQLAGGFARYSTDAVWLVPHFEKMLYDNAQLVSLYSEAYQLEHKELYKNIVYETLAFVEREMTSNEAAFYSSLDADSEGEEGKFYVWTKQELDELLGNKAVVFNDYYNVSERGNWEEHKNIFHRKQTDEKIAKRHDISVADLQKTIAASKEILMKERKNRIRPGLDDKVLTSWNALMLKGYVDAYRAFGEKSFLDKAVKNADFIRKKCMQKDGRLNRNYKNGKSTINGFLDDYSLTIEAFIALYQATFDEKYLFEAKKMTDYAIAHFYDEKSGMFFYTSDLDKALIARKMELSDNVIVGSNSSMAKCLYYLSHYLYDKEYQAKTEQMLVNIKSQIGRNPAFYSNWIWLMLQFVQQPYEVAIVGKDFVEKRQALDQYFLPNVLFLGGKTEGKLPLLENKSVANRTMIYVCQQKACKFPTEEVKKALELMER
ncbi:MAG: thioredoxin domain-containing protein [Chitinophagales bacterium]